MQGVERVRVTEAVNRLGRQTQQPTVQSTLDFSTCGGTGGVGQIRLLHPGQAGDQPLVHAHQTSVVLVNYNFN